MPSAREGLALYARYASLEISKTDVKNVALKLKSGSLHNWPNPLEGISSLLWNNKLHVVQWGGNMNIMWLYTLLLGFTVVFEQPQSHFSIALPALACGFAQTIREVSVHGLSSICMYIGMLDHPTVL